MSDVANNVRTRREALGYSQQELAKIAGVSQTTIDKIERGITKKSRYILYIALALRCSVKDIDPAFQADLPSGGAIQTTDLIATDVPTLRLFASEPEDVQGHKNGKEITIADAGMFSLGLKPIGLIPTAPGAYDSEHCFGVYISSLAMSPELEQGDVAIVDRRRPPIHGATCFFQVGNQSLCTIARLVETQDPAKWEILHLSSDASLLLPKSDWSRVNRVVAKLYRP